MRIAFPLALTAAIVASAPATAQSALPPAQNLDQLERMVVATLGAEIGQPGGPMAPIDRRMRLADCAGAIQIDPPMPGAVTVRCTTAGWRLRVPLARTTMGYAAGRPMTTNATPGSVSGMAPATAAVRRGDPVQLIAGGTTYSISVDATAMEDANIGSRIRVSTASRGSTLYAEVIDIGRVRLLGFK